MRDCRRRDADRPDLAPGQLGAHARTIGSWVLRGGGRGRRLWTGYVAGAAPTLPEGCRDFFVAHFAEALALKALLPTPATLYVFNRLQPGAEAACVDALNIVPVLNGIEKVEAWARHAPRRISPLPAAIQVDSGMSRLGLSSGEVEVLGSRPELLRVLDLRLVIRHLACADEPEHPSNRAQLEAFRRLRSLLPAPASLGNSGGVLLGPSFGHDLARLGLALYGVSPTPDRGEDLRPMVGLGARVTHVRSVPAGTAKGYNGAWHARYDARLATATWAMRMAGHARSVVPVRNSGKACASRSPAVCRWTA